MRGFPSLLVAVPGDFTRVHTSGPRPLAWLGRVREILDARFNERVGLGELAAEARG